MNVVKRSPEKQKTTENPNKAGRPKSAEKRNLILDSATDLFLENGFGPSSMDMVAKTAGVSKQTVYSHFKNKDALFTSVINKKCKDYQMDAEHMRADGHSAADILFVVGNQFVKLLLDPGVIAMYRLVIGEATSNPHVAELFYEAGPQQAMDVLSRLMQLHPELSLARADAIYWTNAYFNLLKGEFHMRTMLGLPHPMSDEDIQSEVQKNVEHLLLLIHSSKSG